ncbi:MAG TPA: class I SAM-dependent methyltransferase [Micromonosporaceae bacterium]|nr:class I SAM-dependent methyltransferase [Micromonosporaceae bacterium]
MEATEVRKLAELEDTHWWYRERRVLLDRALRRLAAVGHRPGWALDIGAAGGGNTRVLRSRGWRPVALEYTADGAGVARERGLHVMQADARRLPVGTQALDLVVAFDILEHIEDDLAAAAEIRRVLRPGAVALVAVPCDMRLWSAHDVAVGHVRRYTRRTLTDVVEKAGLVVDELWSWNVLLRPAAAWRRRRSTGSDLDRVPSVVNLGLTAVIAAERYLPVRSLPGVSLMLRAHRPA